MDTHFLSFFSFLLFCRVSWGSGQPQTSLSGCLRPLQDYCPAITHLACSVSGSDHAEMPRSCLGNEIQSSPGSHSLLCPLAVFCHLHDAQTVPSIGATHQLCLPSVSPRMLAISVLSPHRSYPAGSHPAPCCLLSELRLMGRRAWQYTLTSGNGRGGRCTCPWQGHSRDFHQGRSSGLCLPGLGIAAQVGTGWGRTSERHKTGL